MTLDNLDFQLQNNPLEYRSILTLPEKVNFGLELELDKVSYDNVYALIRNSLSGNWYIKMDESLTPDHNAEIVSPVLQNRKQTWHLLLKMGQLLQKIQADYTECSFQINFDSSLLPTDKHKVRFLKLYAMYEDIIYRFSKGDDKEYRESIEMYASPIILALKGIKDGDARDIIEYFSNNKRYGITFKNIDKELVEFRTPNMTSNPTIMQNYITAFYYLLVYATSNKYNEKEVDAYIESFSKIYLLENYEISRPHKALKLSNMIFPHKKDQLYFMHQYLGK